MGVGSGRSDCATAKTTASSRTSGVQIFTRRASVRTGVCGGGGVFVSSASRSSGGFGGNGCWVVRSGPTCGRAAVASAGATLVGAEEAEGTDGVEVAFGFTLDTGSSRGLRATNLLVRSDGVSDFGRSVLGWSALDSSALDCSAFGWSAFDSSAGLSVASRHRPA